MFQIGVTEAAMYLYQDQSVLTKDLPIIQLSTVSSLKKKDWKICKYPTF